MNVAIVGSGKVGRTLARAIRRKGSRASLRALRRGLPSRPFTAPLLILAVRDGDIEDVARRLSEQALVTQATAVVHVAGSLGPEALQPLRGAAAGIGQAHPLLSFAAAQAPPDLTGAHLLVAGDAIAVQRARSLARCLGMIAREWTIDPGLYHAAAGLLANGTAALVASAAELLMRGGAPASDIPAALGPLLRSVAVNTSRLGLPDALTGPVRRGDAATIEKHLRAIQSIDPALGELYMALVAAQLPLARALADAPSKNHDAIERSVRQALRKPPHGSL